MRTGAYVKDGDELNTSRYRTVPYGLHTALRNTGALVRHYPLKASQVW